MLGIKSLTRVLSNIADLITRTKGLNDVHDDLGTHDTDVKALLAVMAGYGLSFIGAVTTATSNVQFSASTLAGFGGGYFKGYYVYPVWDADGAGGAPQGEHKLVTAYNSTGGVFGHGAFTADLVVTDKVLIVHPAVARILDNYALLTNATYGLSALQALVGAINAATTDSLHGKLGTDTELADNSLYDLLGGNAFKTHSLSTMLGALTSTNNLKGIIGAYTTAANLKAAIDGITAAGPTNAQMETARDAIIAAIPAMVGTNNAALASVLEDAMQKATGPAYNQDTDSLEALREVIDLVKTQTDKIAGKMLFRKVKWSEGKVQVVIDAAGATTVLPTITIDTLPTNATVVEAYLMVKFRMIENKYAGVNKLNGATNPLTSQVFQIQDDGGGAWADGIKFPDDYFTLADAAREGGDVLIGTLNVGVANVVDGNDIYNVRLLLGKSDQDFINLDECQAGLDIWYSV